MSFRPRSAVGSCGRCAAIRRLPSASSSKLCAACGFVRVSTTRRCPVHPISRFHVGARSYSFTAVFGIDTRAWRDNRLLPATNHSGSRSLPETAGATGEYDANCGDWAGTFSSSGNVKRAPRNGNVSRQGSRSSLAPPGIETPVHAEPRTSRETTSRLPRSRSR